MAWRDAIVPAVLVGAAYFIAHTGSLTLASWSNGVASVWLPNAILLAYLLQTPRTRWLSACAAVLAFCALSQQIWGTPLLRATIFGIANVLEPLAVALILGAGRRSFDFERIPHLLAFVGAAIAATLGSATVASLGSGTGGPAFLDFWISWFSSSLLGLIIATPLLLIGWKQLRARGLGGRQLAEGAGALLVVLGMAIAVFAQTRWPLFFLLQPPVLMATFRLRALGAAASVLLIAIVGTAAIDLGFAPESLTRVSFGERMAIFQVFLAVTILTALPVAALLAQRDRYAESLAQSETQLASVVDAVSDVIFRTDRDGRWTYLNPAWEQLTGLSVEESIGTSFLKHVVEEDRGPFVDRLQGIYLGVFPTLSHQFRFCVAGGEHRWGEVQISRLNGLNGELIGSAGIIVDISDRLAVAAMSEDLRRQAEREAEAARLIAATDHLTGVASRRAFLSMLDQLLDRGDPVAVAIFDIDHFKGINDRFGHGIGDEVLKQVAAVAQRSIRDDDLIGRLGGEEFAVLMPGASIEQAARVGERLRSGCAETVHPPGLTATISVGVAAAKGRTTSAVLLREADAALYRAKFEGRNCLRIAA